MARKLYGSQVKVQESDAFIFLFSHISYKACDISFWKRAHNISMDLVKIVTMHRARLLHTNIVVRVS